MAEELPEVNIDAVARKGFRKGQHVVPTAQPDHPVMVIKQFLAYGIAECTWQIEPTAGPPYKPERAGSQLKPEDLTVLTAEEVAARIEPRKCAGCGKPFNIDKNSPATCCKPQCYIDAQRLRNEQARVDKMRRIEEAKKS
jgi:hypothetical protein